jgi:hypothetical protein
MEVETQRQHFTTHGWHLSLLGKELVAIELAKNIRQLLTKVETNIIQMHCTNNNRYGEHASVPKEMGERRWTENNIKPVESNKCRGEKIEKGKKSVRIRKIPITKSNYFYDKTFQQM